MINILLLSCTDRRPYAPQQPEKQSSYRKFSFPLLHQRSNLN